VTQCLKVRISQAEETSIARQWIGQDISMAIDMYTRIDKLFKAVLSMWSTLRLYNEGQQDS
jgi:hypothetical protein